VYAEAKASVGRADETATGSLNFPLEHEAPMATLDARAKKPALCGTPVPDGLDRLLESP
jgi:hypothetical protein